MRDGYDLREGDEAYAPPCNIGAEQALLGALLFDNEVYWKISGFISAHHFYDPLHGRIFEVAADLIGRGDLADAVVLKSRFADDPGMAEIGGPVYLADLMRESPDSCSAVEYARLVFDLAMRREMIRFASEMRHEAEETLDCESAATLLERLEADFYALADKGPARRSGAVSFQDAVRGAVERAQSAWKSGKGLAGLSTGIRALDAKMGGLCASDLIILAGRPSMGKTSLATNIAFNLARAFHSERDEHGSEHVKAGGRVLFFSLEMSDEQIAQRIIGERTGISTHRQRRGEIDAREMQEIVQAGQEIEAGPLWIDDTGGININQLCARARRQKRLNGLDCIIVDYLQLAKAEGFTNAKVQEIGEITGRLKALAKELNVPVIALSQLSRQVEQRDDKRPQLSDLRESGSIEQDADVVLFCYREAYYLERTEPKPGSEEHALWQGEMARCRYEADIIIGKQRHGPIGSVKLAFSPDTTKFSDLEERSL